MPAKWGHISLASPYHQFGNKKRNIGLWETKIIAAFYCLPSTEITQNLHFYKYSVYLLNTYSYFQTSQIHSFPSIRLPKNIFGSYIKCRTEISASKRAIAKKLTKASGLIARAAAVRHQDVMRVILLTCWTKNDRACDDVSIRKVSRSEYTT